MASYLFQFLRSQFFVKPPYPTQDLTNQTIVVTGANTGLGLEAARHFTRLNAERVILAVRTVSKGEDAKKSIEETTGRHGVVEVWSLDLSSYASVEAFAAKLNGLKRLDALVENAGMQTGTFRLVEEDEATITTNVVSTFLLALLALPKLQEMATKYNIQPRLAIVSSEVHFFTSFPEKENLSIFDALKKKETARMSDRYKRSLPPISLSLMCLPGPQIQRFQASRSPLWPRTCSQDDGKQETSGDSQSYKSWLVPFGTRPGWRSRWLHNLDN